MPSIDPPEYDDRLERGGLHFSAADAHTYSEVEEWRDDDLSKDDEEARPAGKGNTCRNQTAAAVTGTGKITLPYGQPAEKYRSTDSRRSPSALFSSKTSTPIDLDDSSIDLDEIRVDSSAKPFQINLRNASSTGIDGTTRNDVHVHSKRPSIDRTQLSSRHFLQQRAKKKKNESKSNGSKSKKYTPSLPEPKKDDGNSCSAKFWPCFSRLCTLFIPNCLICWKKGSAAKQAWREKVAIFQIMIALNLVFLFLFGVIPLYFCREDTPPLHYYEWFEATIEPTCEALNYIVYGILFFTAGFLLLQCFCSLVLAVQMLRMKIAYFKRKKAGKAQPGQESAVMVLVPCYNEGETELRKTIKSILETDYPEENKVLVVVADGIITGKGEWMNTPSHLAKILGFKVSRKDQGYAYNSIGSSSDNRASVYSGVYKVGEKSLKYIVIVKRGTPEEKDSARPGNRGKRDSQLMMMGLFNRVHYDRRLCELDKAICSTLNNLKVPSTEIEYLLAIDADTRIDRPSMSFMVSYLQKNDAVLACCGETKVDNKSNSLTTMIQVFEYFASHALKKSFESLFGCVTCLPGCFTMYRLHCPDDMRPLLSSDNVYQAYRRNDINSLHDKNLFHLGEDRMLTTLLLKYFREFQLNFVPAAACWTIVPSEFKVLLSQRRRWINSTFHNMWELLNVNLCGMCCLSMKAIVILDMLSTMILPGAMLYALSFIYTVFIAGEKITMLTLILYGVILGAQVLIFLVRSRIDHFFWFLIYLIFGIPVFFFILPLYSFSKMDDLSWGTTRQVAANKGPKK